jgi:hypothetical protein
MKNDIIIDERIDRNGTKHQVVETNCDRCGGQGGSQAWAYTGYTCFKCGGTGRMQEKRVIYTPEHEAKLAAQREKRNQKKIAEIKANAEAANKEKLEKWGYNQEKIYMVLGNTYEKREELKAAGARFNNQVGNWFFTEKPEAYETAELEVKELIEYNQLGQVDMKYSIIEVKNYIKEQTKKFSTKHESEYVGQIGEKINTKFKFINSFMVEFASAYTYGIETIYINKLEDENENIFIWKTGKNLSCYVDENNMIQLKGTIKGHEDYEDIHQTILTRCRIQE